MVHLNQLVLVDKRTNEESIVVQLRKENKRRQLCRESGGFQTHLNGANKSVYRYDSRFRKC